MNKSAGTNSKKSVGANGKKTDPERQMAFESLPIHIRETMTDEEKELFLYAEEWPESMFKKFDEFIIPQ